MSALKPAHACTALLLVLTISASPASAQDEPGRAGRMEPLNPEEMESAQVPMGRAFAEDDDEGRADWLRARIFEDSDNFTPATPDNTDQSSSGSRGLSPFQRNFRDAIINQMRGTAEGS